LYFNIWVPVTRDQDDLIYTANSKVYAPNNLDGLKYLNNSFLFSKTKTNVERKPTMFWIHGGGYLTGSSNVDVYYGAYLASTENLIVTRTNYRLGVLGFLYLNDSRAPGNLGINDQITAIEWYK
jgi:carboxylesterase type B